MLHREAIYIWYYFSVQLEQILKYWVMGMVLGSLVAVFLKEHIHNAFCSMREKRLGALGIVIASVLGIASPPLHVRNHPHCGIFFQKRDA